MVWQGGAGSASTPTQAARLSAVYGSWRLLTDAIGTLPVDHVTVEGATRTPSPSPPWWNFSTNTVVSSRVDYLVQVVMSLLIDGTALVATPRDDLGAPIQMVPLDPTKITITRDRKTGERRYSYGGDVYTAWDVMQINGMMRPEDVRGMSPIAYARDVLDGALEAQAFGKNYFANAAVPPAIITVPASEGAAANQGEVDQLRAKAIAETWKATNGGSVNAGKVGVLIGGAELSTISMSPGDSQWLESRQFGVQEIARIYGIPPHLLADSSNSTSWGSGLAEQNLAFGQFALRPWITRIETAHDLLASTAGGWSKSRCKLNLDAVLRASIKDRYESYRTGIETGFLTANEARAFEDLPPLEGGDVLKSSSAASTVVNVGGAGSDIGGTT